MRRFPLFSACRIVCLLSLLPPRPPRSKCCCSTDRAAARITTGNSPLRFCRRNSKRPASFKSRCSRLRPRTATSATSIRSSANTRSSSPTSILREWPENLRGQFEQYISDGGGLVVVHAADNAFPGWTAVQRHDRDRRMARAHREGRPYVVFEGRQAGLRCFARTCRIAWVAAAVPGHSAGTRSPHPQRPAPGVDARAR